MHLKLFILCVGHHHAWVGLKELLLLFLSHRFWGLNSGCKAWWMLSLPVDPAQQRFVTLCVWSHACVCGSQVPPSIVCSGS